MGRIGLFGGTFNPIHNGHLFIAECARVYLDLEKVIFIPAYIPPHKNIEDNSIHRANMVALATYNNNFEASSVEMFRKGPSYTIDTLRHFSKKLPDCEILFIMGEDSFGELHTWKDYENVLKYKLVVVSRYTDGFYRWDLASGRNVCRIYPPNIENKDKCLEAEIIAMCSPLIKISSTQIRLFIKNNLSVRYLLPGAVIDYINQHNLYKER